MYECFKLQGSTNGHDVRKNNDEKVRNNPLEYLSETSIQGGAINEEEYEEFFTPPRSPRKNPSSNSHEIIMKDLTKDSTINFNLCSLNENRIRKLKNGKEKSKLVEDVEIFVLSNGKKEEANDNKNPTVTKADI